MQVSSSLRKVLCAALDADTFAISSARASLDFLQQCSLVIQSTAGDVQGLGRALLSPSDRRTVAVVDRTTDVEQAAQTLVKARLSYGGRSFYAPDLVLVNEFVAEEFVAALVRHVADPMSSIVSEPHVQSQSALRSQSILKETEKAKGARVVVSGTNGSVLDVHSR